MNSKQSYYILDFVIPIGPTGPSGPTGPQGLQGPTGPSTIEAITYTEYRNTSTSENIIISKNTSMPNTLNIFTITSESITIHVSGLYEFTFCGLLKENNTNYQADITLTTSDQNPFIIIELPQNMKTMYFSQSKIGKFNTPQTITIHFNKASNSDASAENIYLIIKKLALDI